MVTCINEGQQVDVPDWVTDIEAFRRWNDEDDFPEDVRIWWLKGKVWIDMKQGAAIHSRPNEVGGRRRSWESCHRGGTGPLFPDGVLLSNFARESPATPTGCFCLKIPSIPIASGSSKARGVASSSYRVPPTWCWRCRATVPRKKIPSCSRPHIGKPEFANMAGRIRTEPVQFDIFRRASRGYTAVRKQDGWVKSPVFGKSFRLEVRIDRKGNPRSRLHVRSTAD